MPFFSLSHFLPRAAPLRPKRASVLREAVAVSSPSVRSAEEIPLSLPRTAEERKEEIGSSLESRATKKVADTDAFTVVFFSIEDSACKVHLRVEQSTRREFPLGSVRYAHDPAAL